MVCLSRRHSPVRNQDARNLLVTENWRLSFYAARQWAARLCLDVDDAVGECNLALIRAAEVWVGKL